MDFYRIAALFIRLTALTYLVGTIDYLSYLPSYLSRAAHAAPNSFASQYDYMDVRLLFLRALLHLGFAAFLFLGWKPITHALMKGCGVTIHSEATAQTQPSEAK